MATIGKVVDQFYLPFKIVYFLTSLIFNKNIRAVDPADGFWGSAPSATINIRVSFMIAKHFCGFSIFSFSNKIENHCTDLSKSCETKSSSCRCDHRGMWLFPRRLCLWVENWLTMRSILSFLTFWKSMKILHVFGHKKNCPK